MIEPRRRSAPQVFINCPFDIAYRPLFQAACFTLLACGYQPRCALDYSDSGAVRFAEIVKMILACDYSIHDISRVELDPASGLPRFNMPLELGADLGLRLGGSARQRKRRILILDAEPHRYDTTLSDISGMDIEAHGNHITHVIKHVRDWLNTNRTARAKPLPGAVAISDDYTSYLGITGLIIRDLRLDPHDDLSHVDFLHVAEIALGVMAEGRGDGGNAEVQ